jgi:putative transposase
MKKSRFTESRIAGILKEGDRGVAVNEIWRKHGISWLPTISGKPNMADLRFPSGCASQDCLIDKPSNYGKSISRG